MQITDSHYCYGPNIYTDKPAFWAILNLGKLTGYQTAQLGSEFNDALLNLLPGLQSHDLEDGESFPALLKNGEGVHVGRLVERIAIELQRLAGHNVSWSTTQLIDTPATCKVVAECHDKTIYPMVLKFALFILNNLLPESLRDDVKLPPGFDLRKQLQGFLRSLRARGLDLSTKAVVQKAIERGIPWQRLHPSFPFVQLGHSCFARRVLETSSCADHPIRLSSNKNVAGHLLAQAGLPVPKQAIVVTARQAVAAARAIGYPVVVKPNQGKKGLGVTTGIMTHTGVTRAAEMAIKYGGPVVVEQHINGDDHRLLIVDGKFVAAAKRIPGHVIGDGAHSIQELVEEVNRDPRRGTGFEKNLVQLELDKMAVSLLKQAGFTPKSVPGKDEIVYLRGTANISTGGTAVDVTEQVHPDNRYVAETAAIQFGLAVSGVDFITPDISRSWRELPGGILEVNRCPGLRPHWIADPERDVVDPILDMLFPENSPVQIPIAAVTGSNGKTTTSQMLAHILQLSGLKCGLATTQGVFIEGRQILHGDFAGGTGARSIFLQPQVEVAVIESARRGLLRSGLSFNRCDVGAVLNVTNDHVGTDGIQTMDELARIKRLVAEYSSKAVILNAEDERCLGMAAYSSAENLCLVATDKGNPHIQSHIAQGGHAVVLDKVDEQMRIVLFDGNQFQPLIVTSDMPASYNNMAFCNVTNGMFAAAMAWEMGINPEIIAEGLRTFKVTFDSNPGRLNVYEELPFRVVLDYAHNPDKYKSMVEFVTSLPTKGRRIIVMTSPGNREDRHFHEIAQVCAGSFDHYFLARRKDPRGRGEFEVQEIICDTLQTCNVRPDCITICNIETEATEQALAFAQPGDTLILVVKDNVGCWQLITNYKV